MKRILSTALAIALLLGLGALAILASPSGAGGLLTAAQPAAVALAATNFQGAAAPDAPDAAQNFNMIAMPLDATNQFTSAGYTFTADGLMKLAGGGTKVKQVGHWKAADGVYETWTWDPDEEKALGIDFDLEVGQAYWLLLESTAGTVISFVGDVPEANSVQFTLVRGDPCAFNQFSIPLEQSAIASADDLMMALDAKQVSRWVASSQQFESWTWDPDEEKAVGIDFPVQIGYPYIACLETGTPTLWP